MTKLSSLQKALHLLDVLGEAENGGMSVSALGRLTGYPGSSVHHMLSTLKGGGYVTQNPETRKYALGFKFLTLSRRVLDNIVLRRIAADTLCDLNARTGEAVFLSILRGDRVLFIDKIQENDGKVPLATDVGFTSEPHASSSGKVLLAALAPEQIRRIYPEEALPVFGPKTISSRTELLRHLEQVRIRGYAIDDEEYYLGIRCLAAPVLAGGTTVACVSITGSVFTMTLENIHTVLLPLVRQAAGRISDLLS
jgi:DNA-binding IclR family transcriptional regulator